MNIKLYRQCAALQGLDHNEKHVLVTLASFAGKDSTEAYPSITTLADNTSLGKTSVRRQLRVLAERRLITPSGNTKGGKGCSTVYSIHPENWKPIRRVMPLEEPNPSLSEAIPITRLFDTHHTGDDEGCIKEKAVVADASAANLENEMADELNTAWNYYLETFRKDEDLSPSAKRLGLATLAKLRERFPAITSEQCVDAMTAAIDAARRITKDQPKKAFFSRWFGIFGNFDTFYSLWEEA